MLAPILLPVGVTWRTAPPCPGPPPRLRPWPARVQHIHRVSKRVTQLLTSGPASNDPPDRPACCPPARKATGMDGPMAAGRHHIVLVMCRRPGLSRVFPQLNERQPPTPTDSVRFHQNTPYQRRQTPFNALMFPSIRSDAGCGTVTMAAGRPIPPLSSEWATLGDR